MLLSIHVFWISDDVQLLKDGLSQFFHTGVIPSYLKEVSKHHQIDFSFFRQLSIGNLSLAVSCDLCDGLVTSIIEMKKIHTPNIFLKGIIEQTCKTFHVEDARVCDGILGPVMVIK